MKKRKTSVSKNGRNGVKLEENKRRKSGWRDGVRVEPGGGIDGKVGEAGEQRQR